jgi:hypothetical protein
MRRAASAEEAKNPRCSKAGCLKAAGDTGLCVAHEDGLTMLEVYLRTARDGSLEERVAYLEQLVLSLLHTGEMSDN